MDIAGADDQRRVRFQGMQQLKALIMFMPGRGARSVLPPIKSATCIGDVARSETTPQRALGAAGDSGAAARAAVLHCGSTPARSICRTRMVQRHYADHAKAYAVSSYSGARAILYRLPGFAKSSAGPRTTAFDGQLAAFFLIFAAAARLGRQCRLWRKLQLPMRKAYRVYRVVQFIEAPSFEAEDKAFAMNDPQNWTVSELTGF